jgi:transcriptional regulator with XRE-family HTH domain
MKTIMASRDLTSVLVTNLRREIRRSHCSQSELARRCGWPPARITELLKGKFDPRLGTVEKIADALEVAPSTLLTPTPAH